MYTNGFKNRLNMEADMRKIKYFANKYMIYVCILIIICINLGVCSIYFKTNKERKEIKNEYSKLQEASNENFGNMLSSVRYFTGDRFGDSYSAEKCNYMLAKVESLEFALEQTDFAIKEDLKNVLQKIYFTLSYMYKEKIDYSSAFEEKSNDFFNMKNELIGAYLYGNDLEDYEECLANIKDLEDVCNNIVNEK